MSSVVSIDCTYGKSYAAPAAVSTTIRHVPEGKGRRCLTPAVLGKSRTQWLALHHSALPIDQLSFTKIVSHAQRIVAWKHEGNEPSAGCMQKSQHHNPDPNKLPPGWKPVPLWAGSVLFDVKHKSSQAR
jgi:hypothetical protein